MKNKMILSITMTSVLSLNATLTYATQQSSAPVLISKTKDNHHSGKCASGKCGTEKIFSKKELTNDPQDKLIYARDGKCGLSGEGIAPVVTEPAVAYPSKITGGLCGQ